MVKLACPHSVTVENGYVVTGSPTWAVKKGMIKF
jgi:hypothetical protein